MTIYKGSTADYFCVPNPTIRASCFGLIADMIDDDIDGNVSELSTLINYPSAEGLFTAVKTSRVAPAF